MPIASIQPMPGKAETCWMVVVLKWTDVINPLKKSGVHCFDQPVLTCQHDVERFKHDSNFVQVLSSLAVLQL